MKENEAKEYVMEIVNQLQELGGFVYMSWGPSEFSTVVMDGNPTLQFKVQGHLFKGYVRVEFDRPRDAYNIHFGRFIKKSGRWINKHSKGYVMFYEMVDVIDGYVEREKK